MILIRWSVLYLGVIFLLCKGKRKGSWHRMLNYTTSFSYLQRVGSSLTGGIILCIWKKALGLTKEIPHFIIALSFQGDAGAWLIFPLFPIPFMLLPLNHRTLCPWMNYRKLRHTLCLDEGNCVIYISHDSALPFVLGHDRKSVFLLNWKASMS